MSRVVFHLVFNCAEPGQHFHGNCHTEVRFSIVGEELHLHYEGSDPTLGVRGDFERLEIGLSEGRDIGRHRSEAFHVDTLKQSVPCSVHVNTLNGDLFCLSIERDLNSPFESEVRHCVVELLHQEPHDFITLSIDTQRRVLVSGSLLKVDYHSISSVLYSVVRKRASRLDSHA